MGSKAFNLGAWRCRMTAGVARSPAFSVVPVRCRLAAVVAATLAFTAVASSSAHAQVTWTGSNGLWSAPNAWSTPLATGTFNSGLVFAGNTLTSSTNDYTTGTATSITFNSTAGAFTISGSAFSLAGNVANSNTNTQTIQNNIFLSAASTFTGTAVTLAGTLTNSGGNRNLTNNLSSGQLLTLGSINLSESDTGRTFTVQGTGSTTITGSIGNGGTAAGNLTKNGTGTLTIAANNGYGGTTTVSAGVLRVAGSGTAFGSGTVSLTNAAGATLNLNGFSQSIAALTAGGTTGGNVIIGGGTLNVGSANTTTTFGGAFTGTPGTLVKQGLGGLTLNGTTSSFSGVALQAGLLTVSPNTTHSFALETLSRSAGSGLVFQPGSGTITVDPATPGSGAGNIIGPWAVMGATTSLTYATHSSGTIVGYTASGTAATASGLTGFSSSENVLLQANSGAMPSSLTVNTIRFAAGNNMTLGSNTLTVNGLMNAGISGLTLVGGTVAIGSANELVLVTNDKGIEIRSVLRETAPGQRLTLVAQGGGALTLTATGGSNQITGAINAMGGSLSLNASGTYGAVNLEASRTLTANFSGVQQIGAIAGVGSTFTKAGTGTTSLLSNSLYTGTSTIQNGMVEVNSLPALGLAGGLGAPTTAANGMIQIGSGTTTGVLRYIGGGDTTDRVVNLSGTTGGATIDASGSGALVFTSAFTATVAGDKTLTLTGTSTAANSIDSIAGSGVSVNKTGAGLWRLTGNNSYTAATTVSAGQLHVSAGNINSSSGITLNGATAELRYNSATALSAPLTLTQGTISGTGTIGTAVTVNTSDVISPGNSPGIQAYTSLHAWAPGGTYKWELNALTGSPGTNWDLVNVTSGTFSLGALATTPGNQFVLDLTTLGAGDVAGQLVNPYDGGSYTFAIASYNPANFLLPIGFSNTAGTDLTSLFTFNGLANWQGAKPQAADISVKINLTATGIDLVIVPEPGALALAGIGIAAAVYAYRRRRLGARSAS
jgi:autotransporter-associated beta strand protein